MADEDDLLDPDEIEALMRAARGDSAPSKPEAAPPAPRSQVDVLNADDIEALMAEANSVAPGTSPSASRSTSDQLSSADIEALLAGSVPPARPAAPRPASPPSTPPQPQPSGTARTSSNPGQPPRADRNNPETTLREVQSQLAAAMAPNLSSRPKIPPEFGEPKPFSLADFGAAASNSSGQTRFPIESLRDVELDLRIELGRAELLLDEVTRLREGSVVPLDKLAGDPVDILVNGQLIARGEILVLNDNFCVRVGEILQPQG